MDNRQSELVILVDAGGSTCRVNICNFDGEVLAQARGKEANFTTEPDKSIAHINAAIDDAYSLIPQFEAEQNSHYAVLGLAGFEGSNASQTIKQKLRFKNCEITSDLMISLKGAVGNSNGTVISIGTGSFFATQIDGEIKRYGGWGMQLGDEMSGAVIGRSLLSYVLHAHDGIIEHSHLTSQVMKKFDGNPRKLVSFALTASPKDYGAFAPDIISAWKNKDAVALDIMEQAGEKLNFFLDSIIDDKSGDIYLLGGLGNQYSELLLPKYKKLLKIAKGDALEGALLMAQNKWLK